MNPEEKIVYKIYVRTSNFQNAGTMATVYLQLFGKKTIKTRERPQHLLSTVKFPLEHSLTNKKKFRPGQLDVFEIEEADVGKMKKLRVSHNGKSVNSGWHLKSIIIKKRSSNTDDDCKWIFKCGRWLDAFQGDKKTECDLTPLNVQEQSDYEEEVANKHHHDAETEEAEKRRNKKKRSKSSNDEKYDLDEFESDTERSRSSLKRNKERRKGARRSSIDSFDSFLSDQSDREDLDRRYRNKQQQMPKPLNRSTSSLTVKMEKITYEIKIRTSEYSKTNSELTVNMLILGHAKVEQKSNNNNHNKEEEESTELQTKLIKLNNMPSDNQKEKFLSNSLDIFRLEEFDVGNVEKIQIFVNNYESDGVKQEWYFDEIVINVPSKCLRYFFDSRSRRSVIKRDNETVFEVYPINIKKVSNAVTYSVDMHSYKFDKNLKTKILNGLSLTLYGDFGNNLKPIKPIISSVKPDKFAVDELTSFHLKNVDIGDLYKLKLIQAYVGQPTNWFLKSFEIRSEKRKYTFLYNKWVTTSRMDKKAVEIKLYEKDYKTKRTISTLSHRLLKGYDQEEIYNESFDDSDNDEEKPKSSSSSRRINKKSNLDKYERESAAGDHHHHHHHRERENRDRGGEGGGRSNRNRRFSDGSWDDDYESWDGGSSSRSNRANGKNSHRSLDARDDDYHRLRGDDLLLDKYSKYHQQADTRRRHRSPSPIVSPRDHHRYRNHQSKRDDYYAEDSFDDDDFGEFKFNEMKSKFLSRKQPSSIANNELDDNYKQRLRLRPTSSLNTIKEDDERSIRSSIDKGGSGMIRSSSSNLRLKQYF